MSFLYPQLLLLLLLLPLVWRYFTLRRACPSAFLRLAIAMLAILALSRPYLNLPEPGVDVLLLVDRSESCRAAASAAARELQSLLKRTLDSTDRLGVLSFARDVVVEKPLALDGVPQPLEGLSGHGSDMASALRMAGLLRVPTRKSVALLLSDGLFTGSSPLSADTVNALRNLPVWYRTTGGALGGDAAAGEIVVPEEVAPRSAWLVRFTIHSNVAQLVDYSLSRSGLKLVGGKVMLDEGENHFFARDTAGRAGDLEYLLTVTPMKDVRPENNMSRAVLRVTGAPRVLLVSTAANGLLMRTLQAAAIPCDQIMPDGFPLSAAQLTAYKVVVLENFPLRDLPEGSVEMLAGAVRDGLCALLVTGGANSFGMGGYHRSALDPLLPVSMELRSDKKRGVMGLAIAMDRSGSMAVPSGDGRTKMDLANLGAAESIRLLSALDQVSVIAVDSSPHVIVPLSRADDTEALVSAVLRIRSMGGGIFVQEALKSARAEIEKSKLPTRHIILFADAADSEQQEGCLAIAKELRSKQIGLSVIAMGTPRDSDARFLQDLAVAGGSEALFSTDIHAMPQLFTQEVIRVSRRGFINEPVTFNLLPALSELGISAATAVPQITGYNFSSLRDGARCFINLNDEFGTPLLALRTQGKVVSAAALFELDGEFSGNFTNWPQTPDLLVALLRRLAGGVNYAQVRSYAQARHGQATVTVEFSPEMARRYRGKDLPLELLGPGDVRVKAQLRWTGAHTAVATGELAEPGHYLPVLDLGEDGRMRAPGVTLPYSAEFSPRSDFAGERTLRSLGEATGGAEAVTLEEALASARRLENGALPLQTPLLLLLLLLFLVELANRRFSLFA